MFPVANCRLTKIEQPGAIDNYGNPTDNDEAWAGSVPGYLKRIARSSMTRGAGGGYNERVQTMFKTDILWLLASDGAPVVETAGPNWEGSTVTVLDERAGSVERRFKVLGMENRVGGTPVDNLRLELASPADGTGNG